MRLKIIFKIAWATSNRVSLLLALANCSIISQVLSLGDPGLFKICLAKISNKKK